MKTYVTILVSCFLGFILIAGCAEDGAPGPQGEEGVPGEKGEKGDKGEPGEKGEKGTANVVYSDWLESGFTDESSYEEYSLTAIDTNQYSLNTSVFLLYGRTSNGVVLPLPWQTGSSTTYHYYIVPDFGTGQPARIILFRDGTLSGGSSIPLHFRYVIIPGGENIGSRKSMPDFTDYAEVIRFYHIPE